MRKMAGANMEQKNKEIKNILIFCLTDWIGEFKSKFKFSRILNSKIHPKISTFANSFFVYYMVSETRHISFM